MCQPVRTREPTERAQPESRVALRVGVVPTEDPISASEARRYVDDLVAEHQRGHDQRVVLPERRGNLAEPSLPGREEHERRPALLRVTLPAGCLESHELVGHVLVGGEVHESELLARLLLELPEALP